MQRKKKKKKREETKESSKENEPLQLPHSASLILGSVVEEVPTQMWLGFSWKANS
jgi:hypothetical protein